MEQEEKLCDEVETVMEFTYLGDKVSTIRMEVASSHPDHLPTLLAPKTFELSLLAKLPFWRWSGQCWQCYSNFQLQCAVDIEADHTDSGIVMDCADQNHETPHLGD